MAALLLSTERWSRTRSNTDTRSIALEESILVTVNHDESILRTILRSPEGSALLIARTLLLSGAIASLRNFRTDFLEEWPTPGTGPHFDISMQSNFTGLVGKTVHLVCKVKNLGNRTVSHRKIYRLVRDQGRYILADSALATYPTSLLNNLRVGPHERPCDPSSRS